MEEGCFPSTSVKLVPWLSWAEWESVRDSLFSNDPDNISFALRRISTWRSRGSLPVVVDVTASIIEIRQKDPFFCGAAATVINSEQMLAMLYCMAIVRLINCVVEKTRKKTAISIGEAAGAIGIPRTLIDIRHEGSHRDLPALNLVRDSASKAIEWMRSYYWERQSKQIPFQRSRRSRMRKEVKYYLLQLASSLKDKQLGGLVGKGKCGKQPELLCGRSKFITLTAKKLRSSSFGGPKKINKILKIVCHLYCSSSSEVSSVLLDFLYRGIESLHSIDQEDGGASQSVLHDWKLIVMKIAVREPELLLTLLNGILNDVGRQTTQEVELVPGKKSRERIVTSLIVEQLPSFCQWLVRQLMELNFGTKPSSSGSALISKSTLAKLIHKCVAVVPRGNKQFLSLALDLAQLVDIGTSLEKLKKIGLLSMPEDDVTEDSYSLIDLSNIIVQQEELIHEAEKMLSDIQTKRKTKLATNDCMQSSSTWVLAESWNPCPIGMLPLELGSSGCLPNLDIPTTEVLSAGSPDRGLETACDNLEPITSCKKRQADLDVRELRQSSNAKKIKESDVEDLILPGSIQGCIMQDRVWKKVQDLSAIESELRILL